MEEKKYFSDKAIVLIGMIVMKLHIVATEQNSEEQLDMQIDDAITTALEMKIIKKADYAITNHSLKQAVKALAVVIKKETER